MDGYVKLIPVGVLIWLNRAIIPEATRVLTRPADMDSDSYCITADGQLVQRGTSLFHARTRELLWVRAISDDRIQLETVSDAFEMDRHEFETQVDENHLIIESQP